MITLRALRVLLLSVALLAGPVVSSSAEAPVSLSSTASKDSAAKAAAAKAAAARAAAARVAAAKAAAARTAKAKAKSNLTYWINRVDPKRTARWTITSGYILGNHDGVAYPWENRVELSTIYVGDNASWAKYLVLHEWSHMLQYRAYGRQWAYATMNAGLLMPSVKAATAIEHQADCIYLALGGTPVTRTSYGCPNNLPLRAAARRIAAKEDLRKVQGKLDQAAVSGRTVTLKGWVADPTVVNARTGYRIIVDGKAVATGVTNQQRTDVNNRYGYVGAHGFTIRVALKPGPRRVCLAGVFWDSSSSSTVFCTTVRVP